VRRKTGIWTNYKLWTSNCLKEILKLSQPHEWLHTPTNLNPADIASRPNTVSDFLKNEFWFEGPSFLLQDQREWQKISHVNSEKSVDVVVDDDFLPQTKVTLRVQKFSLDFFSTLFDRFHSWEKTLRFFALILRFGRKSHRRFKQRTFTVTELSHAEKFVLNACQKRSFKSEFVALECGQVVDKKSPLTSLSPFLDEQKILRANTRLTLSDTLSQDEVTPIVLPKQNIVTEKLVLHLHISHQHIGITYMQNILRAQYHLIGGRRELKRILRSCPNLRCKRQIPVKQIMAPLPKDRVTKADSFSVISIDYFGPLYYKVHLNDKAIEMKKLWVCVFSCLITRCLHLELVLDSSTEEFLNCFRLFVARRGLPRKIISDNFSSFKKADRELRLLFSKINWDKVNAHFVSKQIDW